VRFEELFHTDTIKMEVIVTFIAVLEMVKRGRLQFLQTEPGAPIWIQHPGVDGEVGNNIELTALDEDHATEDIIEPESALASDPEADPETDPDQLNERESES
jgi:hypothetical protein